MRQALLLTAALLLTGSGVAVAQDYHDHGPGPGDHGPGDQGPGPGDHQGPQHWARGDHAPAEYRHHGHEVDWRAHHLRQPPRNYHWVQYNDQYALVGINTGIVNMVVNIR